MGTLIILDLDMKSLKSEREESSRMNLKYLFIHFMKQQFLPLKQISQPLMSYEGLFEVLCVCFKASNNSIPV